MSRRKRRKQTRRRDDGEPIARYECLGCGRKWKENLAELSRMRRSGVIDPCHSGTHCPCGHPYIKWLNYEELAPRLRTDRGQDGEEP